MVAEGQGRAWTETRVWGRVCGKGMGRNRRTEKQANSEHHLL